MVLVVLVVLVVLAAPPQGSWGSGGHRLGAPLHKILMCSVEE